MCYKPSGTYCERIIGLLCKTLIMRNISVLKIRSRNCWIYFALYCYLRYVCDKLHSVWSHCVNKSALWQAYVHQKRGRSLPTWTSDCCTGYMYVVVLGSLSLLFEHPWHQVLTDYILDSIIKNFVPLSMLKC